MTSDDFKEYFDSNIAGVAADVEKARNQVAPHYKKYYKKILYVSIITLTLEIIFHNIQGSETIVLFTPMAAASAFLFGSLVIAFRQVPRTKKFIKIFDQSIATLLAKYFMPDWSFNPAARDMSEILKDCPQFRNISNPRLIGRCFYQKDNMTMCDLDVFYKKSSITRNAKNNGNKEHHSEGLFFTMELPDYVDEQWLLKPDRFEQIFGKTLTRIAEMNNMFFTSLEKMTGEDTVSRRDTPGYAMEIVRFEDEFERNFITYKAPGSGELRYLDIERRNKLVRLQDDLQYRFIVSMNKGKLYFYLPVGAFLCLSEFDMSDDVSQWDFYTRYFDDAQLAYQVISSFTERLKSNFF